MPVRGAVTRGKSRPAAVASPLIGEQIYNPASIETKTVTDTAGADADATNLAVSFTAPASGHVYVVLNGVAFVGSAGIHLSWNLREDSSDVFPYCRIFEGGTSPLRQTLRKHVTGISAGAHTYKLGLKPSTSAGASVRMGGDVGPFSMLVFAVGGAAGLILLGYTEYNPDPATQFSVSGSAPAVDINANLNVACTIPNSGKALVHFDAYATNRPAFTTRQSTSDLYTPHAMQLVDLPQRVNHARVLTGLTPGATTLKPGWFRASGALDALIDCGTGFGPASFSVWEHEA